MDPNIGLMHTRACRISSKPEPWAPIPQIPEHPPLRTPGRSQRLHRSYHYGHWGSGSGRTSVEIVPEGFDLGRRVRANMTSTELGQIWPGTGQFRANSDRCWAELGRCRPNLARHRPHFSQFRQHCSGIGQIWAAELGPFPAEIEPRPTSAKFLGVDRSLAELHRSWAELGAGFLRAGEPAPLEGALQEWPNFGRDRGRHRPDLCRCWFTCC